MNGLLPLVLALALPPLAADPPAPPRPLPSAGILLPKTLEVIVGRARGNILVADTQGKEVVWTVGYGPDQPDLLSRDATSIWVIAPTAGWYYVFASTVVDGHPCVSDGCLVHAVVIPTPPPEPPKPPAPPPAPPPPVPPGPTPIPPVPPKPPEPPAPTDPLTASLQTAYTADPDAAGKARSLDFLGKAYTAMGNSGAPADRKTNAEAVAWIRSVIEEPTYGLKASQLVGVRKTIAQDVAAAMGTVGSAPLDPKKFGAELAKIGKALEGVRP